MKADLLVFDGRHLLWRTSDAFRDLTAKVDGEPMPTGGIYGFLSCALRIHGKFGGMAVVAWEGRTNFRTKLYPSYKRKDEKTDDPERLELISEMAEQERRLIHVLKSMGVRQYRGDNCEADDVIGRLAKKASDRGRRCVIYSGDSDLRQLVDDDVTCVSPVIGRGADKVYDAAAVIERHLVGPKQLAELKALSGDASDNIPGVPGIGPKTGSALIAHYGSLRAIIHAALQDAEDWPVPKRHVEAVKHNRQKLITFYKLTKIRQDRAMKFIKPDRGQKALVEQLKLYRFASLLAPAELHGLMKMGGPK